MYNNTSGKQILTVINLTESKVYQGMRNNMLAMHSIIYSSFPTKETKKLYQCGVNQLRILSEGFPDRMFLSKSFGIKIKDIKMFDYSNALNKFTANKPYQFSLVCNPVVTRLNKRIPLKTVEERGVWLATRCKELGFEIKEFWKVKGHPVKGKNCTLNGVVYKGLLQITDLNNFKKTILSGIGHEKAYGFGLLWLEDFM